MNATPWFLRLKAHFPSETWSWTSAALRQDARVWNSLAQSELGEQALEALPGVPLDWSPAALALLALDIQAALPLDWPAPQPLPETLAIQALNAYEDWRKDEIAELDLGGCGMVALGLLEKRQQQGTWQGLGAGLSDERACPGTVLACLAGLTAEREVLLRTILAELPRGGVPLALHVLLANPLPPGQQIVMIQNLWEVLPAARRLVFFRNLSRQRPELAAQLARELPETAHLPGGTTLTDPFEELNGRVLAGEIFVQAGQPDAARAQLSQAARAIRRAQAHLAAELARTATATSDQRMAVEAWRQAAHNAPDVPAYAAGLALALMGAGRLSEAESALSAWKSGEGREDHPAVWTAQAALAQRRGEVELAAQAACRAFEAVQALQPDPETTGDITLLVETLPALAQLLLDVRQPEAAAQTAQLTLSFYPNHIPSLGLLARADLILDLPQAALEAAALAAELQPGSPELIRTLIDSLEAAGNWPAALEEREALLQILAAAQAQIPPEDLRALANCALHAGNPERAAAVCRQAIQFDPDDGLTFALLAQACLHRGDQAAAMSYFHQATLLSPHLPEPWLALAGAHQAAGETDRVIEVLRSASQATPHSSAIHLALGEAYLAHGAPTQAVAALRRSRVLASGKMAKGFSGRQEPARSQEVYAHRTALLLGRTLHQLGHQEEACQVLEDEYDCSPRPDPELSHIYAQSLLDLNRISTALPILEALVQANPQIPGPYIDYARALLSPQAGETGSDGPSAAAETAIAVLQRALAIESGLPEAQALLGDAYAAKDDPAQAADAYRSALSSPLAHQPAWRARLSLGLGEAELRMGHCEAAVAALEPASQDAPHHPQIQRSLAEAYLALGQNRLSLQAAQKVKALRPADLNALVWYAGHCLQLAGQSGGAELPLQTEAIQALARAAQLAPDRADLLLRLGQLQIECNDLPGARKSFSRIAKSAETRSKASSAELFETAQRLRELGDLPGAIEALSLAAGQHRESRLSGAGMPLEESLRLLRSLASMYQEANHPDLALQILDEALELAPAEPGLSLWKADRLAEAGDPQAALACIQTALEQSPDEAQLNRRAALLLSQRGELAQALALAEKAIAASCEPHLAGLNLSARCLAARLANALLLPEKARQLLGESPTQAEAALDPADVLDYYLQLAEFNLQYQDGEGAAPALSAASLLAPDSPHCLAAQAWQLSQAGACMAAGDLYRKAQERANVEPVDSAARRYLGQAAMGLERWNEAVEWLRSAAEVAPAEPQAQFQVAVALVRRAEAQRRCEAAEVVRHAPGSAALSETAYNELHAAIARVEELSGQTLKGGIRPVQDLQALAAWRARGEAAFQPGCESARALQTTLGPELADLDDLAALVMALQLSRQADEAARAAQAFPSNPLVLLHLGLALKADQPSDARAVLESAAAIAGQRPQMGVPSLAPILHALIARLCLLEVDVEGGRQAVEIALAAWPDEPRWHALAAELAMSVDECQAIPDSAVAIAHLQEAVRLEPDYAGHPLSLGKLYLAEDRCLEAAEILEKCVEIDPYQAESWMALAQAQQAAGCLEEAAASAERAAEVADDPSDALLLRGEIALQANSPRGALSRAQAILHLKPDHPAGLHLLARALDGLNRPEDALPVMEKLITLTQHSLDLRLETVPLLRRARGLPAALQVLQKMASEHPGEPAVLAPLARGLVEAGQYELAVQTARLALQADHGQLAEEERAQLHFLVGRHLRQAGQLDGAVHHLGEALRLSPAKIDLYLELGRAFQERREHAQALEVYDQAIQVDGRDYRPYYSAGLALKEIKEYQEAEIMLRRAAELAPSEVSIHRLLGAVVALNLVHNYQTA